MAIEANVIPWTFYLLLLGTGTAMAFGAQGPTKVPPGTLSFTERVSYQRAIEKVYWRHRIWPQENPNPKPPLDALMSQAQLEEKVEDYLRNSKAVEGYLLAGDNLRDDITVDGKVNHGDTTLEKSKL